MILFGSRTKTMVIAMLSLLCNSCQNPAAHQVLKRQTKFTLFFVPLFPIGPAKYTTQCTYCGTVSQLTKDQAENLIATAPPVAPVAPPTAAPAHEHDRQADTA